MTSETTSTQTAGTCPFSSGSGVPADPGTTQRGPAARAGIFLYGLLAYAIFLATICYAIGFVGDFLVPKSIDSGAVGPLAPALLINGLLLAAFAAQHTIMARSWFKRWITRFIPAPMERSTFVIAASAILLVTFWQWRPAPQIVWEVGHPAGRFAIWSVFAAGWALVFASTFLISHFDLFGLRQVWLAARNRPYTHLDFRVTSLYRFVRHPLMSGFLLAFWATPTMTVGHLFFAVMTTAYILVGVWFEEQELIAFFGDRYRRYRRSVPALIPTPIRRDGLAPAEPPSDPTDSQD